MAELPGNIRERLNLIGASIANNAAGAILDACGMADIPKEYQSTLARMVTRSTAAAVLNSLDADQAIRL